MYCVLDVVALLSDFVGQGPHHLFMTMAEKYGDVFSIKIGAHWNVILNGSEAIKEAFLKNAVEFAGRPMTTSGMYYKFLIYNGSFVAVVYPIIRGVGAIGPGGHSLPTPLLLV